MVMVMGAYVGVLKALLMRSDVKMTITDVAGAGAGVICWQDRFVGSLQNLWNTTSTSTDTNASSKLDWAAALTVPTVFQQPSSSSSIAASHAALASVPLLWRQRAWARLAHPLLALASGQDQPTPSQQHPSLSQSGLLALCGMIVALGQVTTCHLPYLALPSTNI